MVEFKNEAPQARCMSCKEVFSAHNVFTKDGWKETSMSDLCEACFDDSTFPFEEGFEDFEKFNKYIVNLVKNTEGCVLAGGSLRTVVDPYEDIADYDLFFTKSGVKDTVEDFLVNTEKGKVIFKCPENELTTILLGEDKIQLIQKRLYTSLEDLVNSFDLHACCAAYDGENVYKSKKFVSSVLHKLVMFNKIEYPAASMKRVSKYAEKGYVLRGVDAQDFLLSVRDIELTEANMVYYID